MAENPIAAETKISFIDGDRGILEYSGFRVEDLIRNCCYEETAFLILNRRLPTDLELQDFNAKLRSEYHLSPFQMQLITSMPREGSPTFVLRTLLSSMSLHYQRDCSEDNAIKLLGKMPTFVAAFERHRKGQPIIPPDTSLPIAHNFLLMLRGERPDPTVAQALDAALILHADHGLSPSTSVARIATSTGVDIFTASAAALCVLEGRRHGGASEGVITTLHEAMRLEAAAGPAGPADPASLAPPAGAAAAAPARTRGGCAVRELVERKLRRGDRLAGFGHRVYGGVADPRTAHLRSIVCQARPRSPWGRDAARGGRACTRTVARTE
jgi:citrate synthase